MTAVHDPTKCVDMMTRGCEKGESGAVKMLVVTAANDPMRRVNSGA
eukprot:CAMPEP_0173408478 /NCGR_PEP_ID=MMETSP1356-20130122/69820_1 /TAXON_ID=77927 ORGANISM="Hemiselmis virescens, Strain PCC157" /NCGR_SAMPLE_ID=MMETSP1356 /ASSEMBLY_ACC=CAM_ASM_000847 /LENGTH=45 /DNA_ID= /DNA_START= /DNA_END= /DNA_ORIENTATION=